MQTGSLQLRMVVSLVLIGSFWNCPADAVEDILWSKGTIAIVSRTLEEHTLRRTDGDANARYVEVQHNGRTIYGSRNGYLPDSVVVLWKQGGLNKGPDVVIGANTGGSGCCYEVFTFTFKNEPPVEVTRLMGTDSVTVTEIDGIPQVMPAQVSR